ncbi:MAG: Ig-like domain-containing protein [Thermomicrobium sp.]|nr:Ig-like domain-containing protein [Thermomicrobium sp.]
MRTERRPSRLTRLLVVLALAASSLAILAPGTQAAAPLSEQQARVTLAAVYNGETLPGGFGPLWSTVVVQNLEALPVQIRLRNQRTGGTIRGLFTLAPRTSRAFTAAELAGFGLVPSGGSAGLVVEAEFSETSRTILTELGVCTVTCYPAIAVVAKHAGPSALGIDLRTTSAFQTVSGATGIRDDDWEAANFGRSWVLPVVQTNSGWRTVIKVTNLRNQQNQVTLTLQRARGVTVGEPTYTLSQTLAAGQMWTIDLAGVVPPEWVGAAFVDATSTGVAVVAERYKPEWRMLLTNEGVPRVTATTRYAPIVFRDFNNWNTGITLVNLDRTNANTLTLTYYDRNGIAQVVPPELSTITLQPGESAFIYRPDVSAVPSLDPARVNAVVINGQRPFAAAVDEVKYLAGPGQGQAMSYIAPAAPDFSGTKQSWTAAETQSRTAGQVSGRAWFTHTLALPLFQVGNATGQGDVSGFTLFNPTGRQQLANVQILSASGAAVAPSQVGTSENPVLVAVPAGGYAVIYPYPTDFGTTFASVPRDFTGTALVGVTDGAGSGSGFLVGISNVVNYQVAGDGSGVFVLTPTRHPALTLEDFALRLEPSVTLGQTGQKVTLTATLTANGAPLAGRTIRFQVSNEGNPDPASGVATTDDDGRASFTFTNDAAVRNTVTAWWDIDGNGIQDADELVDTSQVTWAASVTGDLTLQGGVDGSDPNYTVAASALAENSTVTTQARCDLSPDTPTSVPVLLEFQSSGDATARWSGQQTASTSGTVGVKTVAGNVATANLILIDGEDGDSYTVTCYLDYGATGVLESTDPQLDSVTIAVTNGS